ncbi:MAG: hypothetical protein J6I73_06780 [Treponema sp.]|nr:hypothetical protein [Treponema sp.]
MSIMVQAAELGYATVSMSIAPQAERVANVRAVLNLPEYVMPHIMVVVGYSAPNAVSSASTNFWDNAKIHKNTW